MKQRLNKLIRHLQRDTRWLSLLVASTSVSAALVIMALALYWIGGIGMQSFSMVLIIMGGLFMVPGLVGAVLIYRNKRIREGKARAYMKTSIDETGQVLTADHFHQTQSHKTAHIPVPEGEMGEG